MKPVSDIKAQNIADSDGWDLEFLDLVGKANDELKSREVTEEGVSGEFVREKPTKADKPAESGISFEAVSEKLFQKERRLSQRHIPTLALVFVVAMIVWASFADIDQVTRAQGKVIPTAKLQLVQSLEGGIVDEILVREGDIVAAQQQLIKLQDTQFQANYQETLARHAFILGRMARLEAEASDFSTPAFDAAVSEDIASSELLLLEARQADYIARKRSLEDLLSIAEQSHRLLERGETSVTKVDLLNALRSVVQLRGELSMLQTEHKRSALEGLDSLRIELAALNEMLTRDKDRLDRTVLRSPMNGVVNKVNVDAQGQVVSSGEDVIEIIPIDESLLVQANVRPEDIGDVHSDQRALVKFTAYDFIRYGGMEGTVEYIGADTVTNEKGETYYPIRIRTESNTMGTRDGRDLSIIPGMVADVDLLAGKKSVLEYLLTPVNRARERALKEQ